VSEIARDIFQMTMTQPDASGVMKALAGITVAVYKRDTTEAVRIYRRRDGATEGPAPEVGATGGPNPFTTGPSGAIEFWCEGPAELDIAIADTIAPARIAPRTMGWNAFPAAQSSIPTAQLAGDAGLSISALSPAVVRQFHAIGEVIEWWRPAVSVPLPAGFEVCDGRQIPAGQHDFPGLAGSAVNIPNLINTMTLGAAPATAAESAVAQKAQGTGANQGDAATDAPGIGGTGGSNAAKNFAHGHGVPGVSHQHHTSTPDHLHSAGSLYAVNHGHHMDFGSQGDGSSALVIGNAGGSSLSRTGHGHTIVGDTWGSGNLAIGNHTGASDRALGAWSGGPNVSLDSATNSTTWTANPGTDMRPRFFGLLKLIKVRRA
jgi:hypothetical protein